MQIGVTPGEPAKVETEALIVPVASGPEGPLWSAAARAADAALEGELVRLADDARFSGKAAKPLALPTLGRLPARRVVLAGVGPTEKLDGEVLARSIGAAARAAQEAGAREIAVALPESAWGLSPESAIEASLLGAMLGLYRFDQYRGSASAKKSENKQVSSLSIVGDEIGSDEADRAVQRAKAIWEAVNLARDLGNEPASTLTPERFAARAREIAELAHLEVDILGPEELAKLGANAMLAVGGGSANSPRLIRLRYQPEVVPEDGRVVGLVGKAITFDTGGYSIKPYEAMLDMKGDMAGGAAVLGTMAALHALNCPVPVVAAICAAENMISGTAFRPGDVIEGMNGVTMEILSTDAEGRLVLADGLVDTARRGATELIDLATLTGAAVVALGNGTTALFASDDALAEGLLSAASETGERMWRMPLIDDLESKIKGDVADIKNTGGRAGGAITAALFLRHFSEELPWAHLDIAGSARQEKPGALGPKGASGVGVRTLLRYLTA